MQAISRLYLSVLNVIYLFIFLTNVYGSPSSDHTATLIQAQTGHYRSEASSRIDQAGVPVPVSDKSLQQCKVKNYKWS